MLLGRKSYSSLWRASPVDLLDDYHRRWISNADPGLLLQWNKMIQQTHIIVIKDILNRRFLGIASLSELVAAILDEAKDENQWRESVLLQLPPYINIHPECGLGYIVKCYHDDGQIIKTHMIYRAN